MEQLKFEQIPDAVRLIFEKLNSIELILQNKGDITNLRDEILNVKETATFLHLETATVYGLVRDAKIPSFKQGNRLYFLKAELVDWIKSGRKQTRANVKDKAHGYFAPLKGGRS